jgi:hypothetical protein
MLEKLGPMLTVSEARLKLQRPYGWPGVATYLLWNRHMPLAIYCGTARTPSRLRGHLHKDDLVNGPMGKTHVNPELRSYCLSQPAGWLGVSWRECVDETEARTLEQAIIGYFGIRKLGGQLFNQRLSG